MSAEGVEWDSRIKRVSLIEKVTTKQRHRKEKWVCRENIWEKSDSGKEISWFKGSEVGTCLVFRKKTRS